MCVLTRSQSGRERSTYQKEHFAVRLDLVFLHVLYEAAVGIPAGHKHTVRGAHGSSLCEGCTQLTTLTLMSTQGCCQRRHPRAQCWSLGRHGYIGYEPQR